jgi:hypothetical protein
VASEVASHARLGYSPGPTGCWRVLGLPARHLPVELGIAEQRRPHPLVAYLGRLALRLQAPVAHEAAAAGDLERDDHAVPGREVRDLGTDLLDHAHRLVAEDVPFVRNGASTS